LELGDVAIFRVKSARTVGDDLSLLLIVSMMSHKMVFVDYLSVVYQSFQRAIGNTHKEKGQVVSALNQESLFCISPKQSSLMNQSFYPRDQYLLTVQLQEYPAIPFVVQIA
jgi:hypothetical protein